MQRDFTINGLFMKSLLIEIWHLKFILHFTYCSFPFFFFRLMFDPYARIVYDYMGGMEDIQKAKVCLYS